MLIFDLSAYTAYIDKYNQSDSIYYVDGAPLLKNLIIWVIKSGVKIEWKSYRPDLL